jgi:hypothetical protein
LDTAPHDAEHHSSLSLSRRSAGLSKYLAIGTTLALEAGLAAHLLHVGEHTGHGGIGDVSHWLPDSALAVPAGSAVGLYGRSSGSSMGVVASTAHPDRLRRPGGPAGGTFWRVGSCYSPRRQE